ncbi:PTS sugar transporter subunit IIA [Pseudolactococcus reticulitermitis]
MSPVDGIVKSIETVNDPVFSQKMIGDGFAILPHSQTIYAPINGVITNIFPTKHALGMISETGVEVLLHFGIDTVELKGQPFEILVTENQTVTTDTKLALIDLEKIAEFDKEPDILVILTNQEQYSNIALVASDKVAHQDIVAKVSIK